MNIGTSEAMKLDNFDCFIYHDVDLIPENDYNVYECHSDPRHLSPAVDELRYKFVLKKLYSINNSIWLTVICSTKFDVQ